MLNRPYLKLFKKSSMIIIFLKILTFLFRNITCQSGVDTLLNKNRTLKGKSKEDNENMENDIEDRNFIDMVTSKLYKNNY